MMTFKFTNCNEILPLRGSKRNRGITDLQNNIVVRNKRLLSLWQISLILTVFLFAKYKYTIFIIPISPVEQAYFRYLNSSLNGVLSETVRYEQLISLMQEKVYG